MATSMKAAEPQKADGGDLLARTLGEAGVEVAFALHGGHLDAFFKGCLDHGIELLDTRHEAAAGNAADGYARVTGKVGVCVATAGPGFTNAMSAIAQAYLDAIPVLFIIGAPPLREAETNPLQGGIDQIAMVQPTAKWAHRVTNTERIADLTARAIQIATNGRPGPVVLEFPIDILHTQIDEADVIQPTASKVRARPGPAKAELAELAALLKAADRPAIVAGGGARLSDCGDELRRLAEAASVPVFVNGRSQGIVPHDHPLFANDVTNLAALPLMGHDGPDLIVMLGARMGLFTGGRSAMVLNESAKMAQIDIDAGEIGRLRSVDLGIAADCNEVLTALNEVLAGHDWPGRADWVAAATSCQHAHGMLYPDGEKATPIHPYYAARDVIAGVGDHDVVYVLDGGEAGAWAQYHVAVDEPGRVIAHGYLGCLGYGTGAAIGAQRARPDKRVILVTGDGAFGFHMQEFDTMIRHGLPIVTVIFNNLAWGMSIHGQRAMYGANYNVITKLADTPYHDIAGAFGCHSERVTEPGEVQPAIRRALESGKPACVNIMVDREVIHPTTQMLLGGLEGGGDEVIIPYYENIPKG